MHVQTEMDRLHIVQSEIAIECGLSQPHISRMLSGKVKIGKKSAAKLQIWLRLRSNDGSISSMEFATRIARTVDALPLEKRNQFMQFISAIERIFAK